MNTSSGSFGGSSSVNPLTPVFTLPVSALRYEDIVVLAAASKSQDAPSALDIEHEKQQITVLTLAERDAMLAQARAEGAAEREREIGKEYQSRFEGEAATVVGALAAFKTERRQYFSSVESEVVRLALAIAAKILHRESQVDPMLLAALVRVAVNQLHDGSKVTVRIHPGDGSRWREFFRSPRHGTTVDVVEDGHVGATDCILETGLGSANFSIDGQLKEVEQGFCDLLALRPAQ